MRIRLALLVALIFSATPIVSGAADRGDRFALVIGNAKYPDAEAPLKEPINDARDIAEELKRDGFSLETVLGEINSRGAGVKIALVDASRRNPFERRFRSFSAGLAPVIAPNGTLVMYSAALSSVISDNGSDRSLFAQHLIKEIRVPDLMAEETLNRIRVGVTRASRSEQVPWISSSLAEDFSFIPGTVARPSAPAIAALPQPAAA